MFILGAVLLAMTIFEKTISKPQNSPGSLKDLNLKNLDTEFQNIKNSDENRRSRADNMGKSLSNANLNSLDVKKISDTVVPIPEVEDSKTVLKPMTPKAYINNKKFKFTPNYEKPMKVSRRPKKRIPSDFNGDYPDVALNDSIGTDRDDNLDFEGLQGNKSQEVVRALASDDFIRPLHAEHLQESTTPSSNDLSFPVSNDSNLAKPNRRIDSGINRLNEDLNLIEQDSLGNIQPSEFLNSYIVSSNGNMTSEETFEELAKNVKNEASVEMASIRGLDDEFLIKISSMNTRMIIEEFAIKDLPYVLLVVSLIERGVKIKTLPLINTTNIITDESQAVIISESEISNDSSVGAIYDDFKSITNIKSMFEKSWNIAMDLDIKNLR
jgi:hypothetical protein